MEEKPTLALAGIESRRQYTKIYDKSLELRNKTYSMFEYIDDIDVKYFLEDILSKNSKFCKILSEVEAIVADIQGAINELIKPIGD